MSDNSSLVITLVERLITKLPHRTGADAHHLLRDEIALLSRTTLVNISKPSIAVVAEALVQLLEELARPYKTISAHPLHVLHSEFYVLELLAECCTTHWESINASQNASYREDLLSQGYRSDDSIKPEGRRASRNRLLARDKPPEALDDDLAKRLLDVIKLFSNPIPEGYVLPASNILDDVLGAPPAQNSSGVDSLNGTNNQQNGIESTLLIQEHSESTEACIRKVVEFVSFSNWPRTLEYLRGSLRGLLAAQSSNGNQAQNGSIVDDEALVTVRLIPSFWVDSRKLGVIIQELCGSFLHLRKAFQTIVAVVVPQLITRWLERNPEEFIELHTMHKRLDGGAETLFDMTNSMIDAGRRKTLLFPFQTSLLFLLPDVFEVASNMRDIKSSSISKKVSFLEMLRKTLRNRNEAAIYCLTSVLRVARHFPLDSDSALLSYALDVQEEVREAVFRRYTVGAENTTIDSGLMTAAFVSLAHLNFKTCVDNLAPFCLAPNTSPDFKLAAIRACTHFAKQSNVNDYKPLFAKMSEFIRTYMKKGTTLRFRDSYPVEHLTMNRQTKFAFSGEVVYSMLIFLHVYPMAMFVGLDMGSPTADTIFEDIYAAFLAFLTSEDEKIRILSSEVCRDSLAAATMYAWRKNNFQFSNIAKFNFWESTSVILSSVSSKIINQTIDEHNALAFVHSYLQGRLDLLKKIKDLTELEEDVSERLAAYSMMETSFLVTLCSPDIAVCQLVASSISLFAEEIRLVESAPDFNKLSLASARNMEVYQELSSKDFRFTGIVAFQKRARGLLRQMQHPTAGIINAWETIFDRWVRLSKQLIARSEVLDERSLGEWRNCSGFLASLGGICVAGRSLLSTPDDQALASLRWIDKVTAESYDETLLNRYMRQSVQLLASNSFRIREGTRDALSSDLAKPLHMPLFEALQTELDVLFDSPRSNAIPVESRIVFAEQAAALLKSIVEKLGSPAELGTGMPVDIGALALNFAKFLNGSAEGASALRVKIKICQLCETLTQKKELLNLRHDVRIRNQLLEVIFGWIARPGTPNADTGIHLVGNRLDELVRLQKDLDRASLKALAELTYRLPLQPAEGQSDADTSDLKSQMFHTYFNRFLSLLNHESAEIGRNEVRLTSAVSDDSMSSPELAISALSNLLSANIDVGLKHSLGIGYHEDLEVRTAFVKVLCNILIQGTEFNNLSDAAVNQKYDELLELLVNDMTLTIALCDACPSTEVDEMTISLLNIFDSRGMGFSLLEALIEHEVEETENEAELLRRNCVATKLLSVYAKWKGAAYLKATLQKVLERLVLTSKDLDLELDPARTTSPEELQKNALQLRVVTKVFIDDICNSASRIPVSFRKICNIISSCVMRRFPDAKFTAVGAFIFLRFFCPAIVAPDAEGLIASPPSKEMRRGLLLIAKVVQNLANNVLFGAKEPYMYPLNDFLTQNIYRVTTFLREISAPPNVRETLAESESFDFGSCVALHRFLYDHWDHVRQKLVLRERQLSVRSPIDGAKSHTPVLDALRTLISNLGPPPMDVSWNRPAISQNTPPSYSRFQHFMLRNAGRSSEAVVSNRAVYDGGESKDGLSMICIILRNIDTEGTDYDLLLYVYLKIASRMWHKPFGILIDATCYNGQNEPQDALFRRLDLLTPSELSKQLSRVYVYNMNSAFRKCFRRILRLSAKSENSAFHPKNVDYHLIGSLQDLQSHFHLTQLHLPKETISVVTDTRYVFQPIIRLSKTKGKVEVIIKIGNQFVQVTTTKKQEVVPGLRLHATVNDIFRLAEVDEAPTSIQTEDDSAFGLRTDNGKIVMYFTSPRKGDILQAIRSAKTKHGKELRTLKSIERLVRPQDVPGTLLNIALTNMASPNAVLRLASYNLLCALCRAFKFAADSKFMSTKELCVPLNPSQFIVGISAQLARSEPQLTGDFLNEFFVGWESFPYSQRPLSLAYMAPWLPSLRTHLIPNEADGDKGRDKVAVIFRKLIEVAISDVVLSITLEQSIWPAICKDEVYMDIFLEEILKPALSFGIDDERTEILGSILASLDTITIRGKLISRLRKALNRTSLRPTRHLHENTVWGEICVLLRLTLSVSFDSGVQSQLYLPEVFHLVTMLANTGSSDLRLIVHRLLVNTIHAMCTTFVLEESKLARLKVMLSSISEPRQESPFSILSRDGASLPSSQDSGPSALLATESLAGLLSDISIVAAPTVDLSNAWRARWMSLVASTAFQSNPAIQPRAFTVMGCLAREDVDDDLLYQVLVALRSSIGRYMEDSDSEMMVAIVTALTKMMNKLPSASRYGTQLFWLALSLVRLVPIGLFNCAAMFLDAVLLNIGASGELSNGRMISTLLQGRAPLDEAAIQLDEIYGIHFTAENFHFAISACMVKGMTDSLTRSTAMRVISTFLDTTITNAPDGISFPRDISCIPYLGLLLARALNPEDAGHSLWLATATQGEHTPYSESDMDSITQIAGLNERELLLTCAIGLVDFHYLDDIIQNRALQWLNKLAVSSSNVMLRLSGPITNILDDVLISCQNSTTLESAHQLLRTITSNPQFSAAMENTDALDRVLSSIGFEGLWKNSTYQGHHEVARECTALTDKLIELIIA
ncbi:375e5968-07eb-4595-a6f9-690f2b9d45d8 [Sclerotinia trifoliorum]|uniref:375e5968-07eb-4595-a6f9-690f2b9d45d8 n=1 Tax=Sclerotinia trifoliorum TaxID=28548 RepID=A0A8H2ZU64_9HELO|nr:375e5968-07eb-4595-a6f9-690f2b9d45d8 [Sclerotinia trifoliorum]